MAGAPPTSAEQDALVSSFLEIAAGQTPHTATQFLQMTSWHLEEALQLFYIDGEAALAAARPGAAASAEAAAAAAAAAEVEEGFRFHPPPAAALEDGMLQGLGDEDDVRAPLPVRRETLYGDTPMVVTRPNAMVAFRNFEEEARKSAWDSEQNATSSSRDNLAAVPNKPIASMATKQLPPESLPRRSPSGGFQPITIHVRVKRDGSYLPRYLPVTGGPFRDFQDLEEAVRARYTDIYLTWHRRKRPLVPPPPSTDSIFQFRYVVEHVPRRPIPCLPQRPQEPADASSLKELLSATMLGEKSSGSMASFSSSSRQSDQNTVMTALPPSGSHIWRRVRHDWGFIYYIRVDCRNYFHTYPPTGGPFQSFGDAECAMDRFFYERRDPTLLMNQGGVSSVDMAVEKALFWPDGRRKKCSKSIVAEQTGSQVRRLVQALVDKRNDDHKLFGDRAYELKDVVNYQKFCEKHTWFYHLNFTMAKVADVLNCGKDNNLFFAEVKCVRQGKQEELLVSCFCMVNPTKNGLCYGCTNNGSVNMKHPNGVDEYIGGNLDVRKPFGCDAEWSDSDDDLEAKKTELRRLFTGSDDPDVKTILAMHPDEVMLEED